MNPAKLLSATALFVALLFPLGSPAQTPPPARTNAASAERFLVIVETSAAMQKRAENVQKALGSVISSGLGGHMGDGSTIGLWTFNEKLFTGQLPLQLWTPATRQRVALTMVQFLQQQKNEKAGRVAAAWEAMTNVVAQSERITVLLITSGNDPLVGTPFDAAITESFIKNADAQRKSNMPFVTILRAVKGKFVNFAVNMPPWPLEVPEYPDGFRPVAKPAPTSETKPGPPPVAKMDRTVLSPTNTIYLAETAAPAPVIEPPPPSKPTPTPATVAPVAKPEPKPSAQIAARAEKAAPPVEPGAAEGKKFPLVTILIAGIAVLLAIMVVFVALLRWSRQSTGASLITRSMNKDDR